MVPTCDPSKGNKAFNFHLFTWLLEVGGLYTVTLGYNNSRTNDLWGHFLCEDNYVLNIICIVLLPAPLSYFLSTSSLTFFWMTPPKPHPYLKIKNQYISLLKTPSFTLRLFSLLTQSHTHTHTLKTKSKSKIFFLFLSLLKTLQKMLMWLNAWYCMTWPWK